MRNRGSKGTGGPLPEYVEGYQESQTLVALVALVLQAGALIVPAVLITNLVHNTFLLFLTLLVCVHLYPLVLTLLGGLMIRYLPKPPVGWIANRREHVLWMVNIAVCCVLRHTPARMMFWVLPFPGSIFYRLCRAEISQNAIISSPETIQEPYLIKVGERSLLGEGCRLQGHYRPRLGDVFIGKVEVGNDVLIGRDACLWPNVIVRDNAIIQENSVLMPGTIVGVGEIWGGAPARLLGKTEFARTESQIEPVRLVVNGADSTPESLAIQNEVREYVANITGVPVQDIDAAALLYEDGILDSLSILQVIDYLEGRYSFSYPRERVYYSQTTLERLVEVAMPFIKGHSVKSG